MDILADLKFWDLIFHTKAFLTQFADTYPHYLIPFLFLVIFCETGFVVTPFLPGDSLLFVSGVIASGGHPDMALLLPILCLAPIMGDSTNYWIGRVIGPKVFHKEKVRFLNRQYLDRAHAFYQKHGGKAVAIGRFMPIIRTFVPFVAGIGKMSYLRFLTFSVVGTLAWINLCTLAGYFLGKKIGDKHFELVVVAIIVISLLPAGFAFAKARLDMRKGKAAPQEPQPPAPQE